MSATYQIHPGIGIARLGNSPDEFCLSPEAPGRRPTACDRYGNPLLSPDGKSEQPVEEFKDAAGRIKRQAARFQIYVFDEAHPDGRPLRLGDEIKGGGNAGRLVDIRWRVYLANKKSAWYEFKQLEGEHGYAADHPRRNAKITDPSARQQLIIDPGPRIINCRDQRSAAFDRDSADFATTFPPSLEPCDIDTLGSIQTDDSGRLLILGGMGHSGSYRHEEFGEPRITSYANNDGWFDDTSDGSVMARLVMFDESVQQERFVDVEYPAWVICGYPAYAPEILDLVTLEDVMEDLSIRRFATRTDLYGRPGKFSHGETIAPEATTELANWTSGRLAWNPDHKPWFFRDIWPILFRPDEFVYLTAILGSSNYPHNQSARGSFDPHKLGVTPQLNERLWRAAEAECLAKHRSGDLLLELLDPILARVEAQAKAQLRRAVAPDRGGAKSRVAAGQSVDQLVDEALFEQLRPGFAELVSQTVGAARAEKREGSAAHDQLATGVANLLQAGEERVSAACAKLARLVRSPAGGTAGGTAAGTPGGTGESEGDPLRAAVRGGLIEELSTHLARIVHEDREGVVLERALSAARARVTEDPFRALRNHLYSVLRQPGEENVFSLAKRPNSRGGRQPLMPLLNGDNPISNTLTSKFFRLTDYQLYLLRQWCEGKFYNEVEEGWANPDPFNPYAGWTNRNARDLDRGVLSNLLGGSFCPGAEVTWIIRNPGIYREPYRIRADPDFFNFRQTAANANQGGQVRDEDFIASDAQSLSQESDFKRGLQPGDLTKYMAVPWQSDFNECTTQKINVTYDDWNQLYPDSEGADALKHAESSWETMWWPGHRPMQTFEVTSVGADGTPTFKLLDWSRGIPGTYAGDAKMVTAWSELGFVVLNPYTDPTTVRNPVTVPPNQKYISVERNQKEGA